MERPKKATKTAAGEVSDAETLQDMTKEELIGIVLDLRSEIGVHNKHIMQYKSTIADYNDGILNLNLKCENYERKIEEYATAIDADQASLKEVISDLNKTKKELNDCNDRINRYVITLSNLQADCTVHEQRNDELVKKLNDMTDNRNENRSGKWDANDKIVALNLRMVGLAEALRIISEGLKHT